MKFIGARALRVIVSLSFVIGLSGCQSLAVSDVQQDKTKSGFTAPIHNLPKHKRCNC